MRRTLALVPLSLIAAFAAGDSSRAPVLVELFTSEGCSSCPPADQLLRQLDSRAVVLGEHVDYWDRLGWRDRFSSPAFTERQQDYGRKFHLDSVYTPEMVVDGSVEFTGSDARRASAEIARAAEKPKAKLHLTRTTSGLDAAVEDSPHSADIFLALAEKDATSQVSKGENSGRELRHISVVRSIRKIGSVKRGGSFQKTVELPAESGAQRIILFVQDGVFGGVFGASVLDMR